MQIPVNKDIDDYKEDFFKGLTMKQTIVAAATVIVGVAAFFLFNAVFGLPQTISLYLVFPVALPIAAAGFVKIDGMSPMEYIKRRYQISNIPIYHYQPMVFQRVGPGGEPLEDTNMYSGKEKSDNIKTDKKKNGKKDKMGLLGPGEDVKEAELSCTHLTETSSPSGIQHYSSRDKYVEEEADEKAIEENRGKIVEEEETSSRFRSTAGHSSNEIIDGKAQRGGSSAVLSSEKRERQHQGNKNGGSRERYQGNQPRKNNNSNRKYRSNKGYKQPHKETEVIRNENEGL